MKKYYAIGLMSGTSLDGLDICHVEFWKEESWHFHIINSETITYPSDWLTKLKDAIHLKSEDLLALDVAYGFYLSNAVLEFRRRYQIQKIDIIASHGHTVFHQPERKFTLQIGDGRAIKTQNPFPVVYDFRSQDVIFGGNGAPLVPIGDELLFGEYDACLNLGGFSNISFRRENKRMAFDICPVNIVLNALAQQLHCPFDKNGELAKKGEINNNILTQLNQLKFYHQQPPKSLGIEWVLEHINPIINRLTPENALATFTQHCVEQIEIIFKKYHIKNCLITGGGAYNQHLIHSLQSKTDTQIIIPDAQIIEYKEALIFAFMGVLKLRNESNILASATGSPENHCSGILV
ncbi:MAG: anhydro-N-acetylmuramic acid kinase [Flavobacteriales bacterium]|nr:MAG: anhydro-N-acetylmuramic acid kinase [Flavobacteriales bacterium]